MRDRTSRLSGFVLPYPTVKLQGTIIRFKSDTWPARLWARSPLLCGLGSICGPGVTWRLSFWLVLVHALFHLVVQFSSPYENQHSNFKFDLETMDKKSHLVESPPLNSFYNYHYYFAFDNDNPSSMQEANMNPLLISLIRRILWRTDVWVPWSLCEHFAWLCRM